MAETEHRVCRLQEVWPLASRLAGGCARPAMVAAGLAELITNGIEHGNLAIGFAEKRAGLVRGDLTRERDRRLAARGVGDQGVRVSVARCADVVCFRIRDEGAGFDWRPWLDFDRSRADAPNGRGIALARSSCFESLNYLGCGNEVEAVALRAATGGSV